MPARSPRRWIFVGVGAVLVAVIIAIVVFATGGNGSTDGGQPAAVLSPVPSPSFHDGQVIGVSVGPNKVFAPNARIEILQCADPGGQSANLPRSDIACDGNTAPGFSVLVNQDGSFSTNMYRIYSLPNATALGEPRDNEPVCNTTHLCVLYVGQDQTNFRAPKLFSAPFSVTPTGSSSSGGG